MVDDRTELARIATGKLADVLVTQPDLEAILFRKGDNLISSACDWAMTVEECCHEQRPVPRPLPWLFELLTVEQRSLDWRHFCKLPTAIEKAKKQAVMF